MGKVIRAARGRPGLTENELVDLTEAAAIRAGVDLAVLTTRRRTIALKDPIYEVTLVQHLVEYALMFPGLDRFEIGWEVPVPNSLERVDIVLRTSQKNVLIECKDFSVGSVNNDATKLSRAAPKFRNAAGYVLAFWRENVPVNVADQINIHYGRKNGLDSALTALVAHKTFEVYAPERSHLPFGVGLFRVK